MQIAYFFISTLVIRKYAVLRSACQGLCRVIRLKGQKKSIFYKNIYFFNCEEPNWTFWRHRLLLCELQGLFGLKIQNIWGNLFLFANVVISCRLITNNVLLVLLLYRSFLFRVNWCFFQVSFAVCLQTAIRKNKIFSSTIKFMLSHSSKICLFI